MMCGASDDVKSKHRSAWSSSYEFSTLSEHEYLTETGFLAVFNVYQPSKAWPVETTACSPYPLAHWTDLNSSWGYHRYTISSATPKINGDPWLAHRYRWHSMSKPLGQPWSRPVIQEAHMSPPQMNEALFHSSPVLHELVVHDINPRGAGLDPSQPPRVLAKNKHPNQPRENYR